MSARLRQTLAGESATADLIDFLGSHKLALLACIPLAYLLLKIFRAAADPLRGVPGPLLARFSRLWLFSGFWSRKYHDINYELHQKYGPIVRVAPGQYSIDDAEATKNIYGHNYKFLKVKLGSHSCSVTPLPLQPY